MSFDPQVPNAFSPVFLQLNDRNDVVDSLTGEAAGEAHTVGPWSVRPGSGPWEGRWEVAAEGREPVGVVESRDTALLVAAAVPALGRRLFRLGNPAKGISPTAHELIAGEAVAGHLDVLDPDIFASFLNVLEYLRRSPLDLARVMYASRGTSLQPAGALLWLWEQQLDARRAAAQGR
jgi:hypothetical protein